MSMRLKVRSVSEQDLGSTVKQMLDGALEDIEQLTKLQRAVYEEWYFKKMDEMKKTKHQAEHHEKELNNDPPDCKISNKNQSNTNSSVYLKSAVIDNEVKNLEESDIQKCIDENLNDFPTSNQTKQLSELDSNHDKCLTDIEKDEYSEAIAAPVVHTIRRIKPNKRITKIVRLSNTSDTDVNFNASEYNLALRLKDCARTSINLTESQSTVRNSNGPLRERNEEIKEKLKSFENSEIQENSKLIEVWKGVNKNVIVNDQKVKIDRSQKKVTDRTTAGEAAFEMWKRAKNAKYNRIFKEEQKLRQLEKAEKLKEEERKRNAYEVCRRVRKQRETQRKLNFLKKRVMEEVKEAAQMEFNEKQIANVQAFKSWKRQKDNELKERRMMMMMMMSYNQQCYQQKTQMKRQIQGFDKFTVWLNQLDCVLHQKYLRERRHLVRSFYCQPAYYGSAVLSG